MGSMAAAAMGSTISPSINSSSTFKSRLRTGSSSSSSSTVLRLFANYSDHHLHLNSAATAVKNYRHAYPRAVMAAVAQEEAATATASEEEEEEKNEEAYTDGDGGSGAEAEEGVTTKLYVGNLPYNVDSAELAGIIQDHAAPELIEVLYDRNTGKSRGFAFVTMSSVEECNTVIEKLDGSQYMGRILRVNFADKPKPKEPLYPESEYKLFVGNLSWSVTSESLTKAFQEYGNVVGARVLYDGESGKSRGYGFVCYSTKAEMEAALGAINGMELEGRALRVSLAEGKR